MGIFGEWWTFFNNVIVGFSEETTEEDPIPSTIESTSVMGALSAKVSNVISKYQNSIKQNFNSDQKIVVDCGSARLTNWHLKKRGTDYNFLGQQIQNSGCVQFGCCYDITQTANVKLSAINETTIQNHQEMVSEMKQTLLANVSIVVGADNPSLTALNSAANQVEDATIEHIRKSMENLSNQDIENSLEIVVKSLSPLRCKNQCNQAPTAGTIDQSLNVEIAAENIMTDYIKSVSETYISMTSETDSTIEVVDMKKIYLLAIWSVLVICAAYFVCCFVAAALCKIALKGKAKCPKPLVYLLGCIMMVIIYLFWGIVLCILRSGSKAEGMLCMF
jgi:hypothetical protein